MHVWNIGCLQQTRLKTNPNLLLTLTDPLDIANHTLWSYLIPLFFFRVVSKHPVCVIWFCHKARVWQTDGRLDLVCTPYPTSLLGETGKRRLWVDGHALVSGRQNIELSNRKVKSAQKCTVWSQRTPVPGRWADRHTNRRTDGRTSCQ